MATGPGDVTQSKTNIAAASGDEKIFVDQSLRWSLVAIPGFPRDMADRDRARRTSAASAVTS